MCGATCKITHQNPVYLVEMENHFRMKDSENGGYREVFLGKESNTGRLCIGIAGKKHTLFASLDDVAKKTLIAFLSASDKNSV